MTNLRSYVVIRMYEMQSIESTEIRDHQQTADAWSQTVLAVRTMDLMGEQLNNTLSKSVTRTMIFWML